MSNSSLVVLRELLLSIRQAPLQFFDFLQCFFSKLLLDLVESKHDWMLLSRNSEFLINLNDDLSVMENDVVVHANLWLRVLCVCNWSGLCHTYTEPLVETYRNDWIINPSGEHLTSILPSKRAIHCESHIMYFFSISLFWHYDFDKNRTELNT